MARQALTECSPRRRRCSGRDRRRAAPGVVLSAQAEVFRRVRPVRAGRAGALRAGGGVPSSIVLSMRLTMCSPRRRRCSDASIGQVLVWIVLSAQAEVFRRAACGRVAEEGALRAGGGVPAEQALAAAGMGCSPRRRRCSGDLARGVDEALVLSAQAEVFRRARRRRRRATGALRAGGGVPHRGACCQGLNVCSPRRRRCSVGRVAALAAGDVLSAQAEVFRWRSYVAPSRPGALRAGGGVPQSRLRPADRGQCSPRRRRCSAMLDVVEDQPAVLSAQAEVFRRPSPAPACVFRALRAGGGVPSGMCAVPSMCRCSPRRRRCSAVFHAGRCRLLALSAQAEVFRDLVRLNLGRLRALRAGGGVPSPAEPTARTTPCSPRRRRCSVDPD